MIEPRSGWMPNESRVKCCAPGCEVIVCVPMQEHAIVDGWCKNHALIAAINAHNDMMRERDKYKAALELIARGDIPGCRHGYDCSCERIYAEQVLKQ